MWALFRCLIGWHEWGRPVQSSPGWLIQHCRRCGQLVGMWYTTKKGN